jgi:hypothetical protein
VANDFNPMYELANRKITQNRNRFTGAARARWRVNEWLSAEGQFAYDQESQDSTDLTPFGYLDSNGQETDGFLAKSQRNGRIQHRRYRTGAWQWGKIRNARPSICTKTRSRAAQLWGRCPDRAPEVQQDDK